MPYIHQHHRDNLAEGHAPQNAGELNFLIHDLIEKYIDCHGLTYQSANDIIGALECVKQEFYRRKVAPYEDAKILENGDIPLYRPLKVHQYLVFAEGTWYDEGTGPHPYALHNSPEGALLQWRTKPY